MEPRSALQLIRDWYAMLAAGDVKGALAVLDPDIEWIEAASSPYGGSGPIRGPEAVLRTVWLPLQRDWERIVVEVDELIELAAGVLALVHYRGVRRGTRARLDAQAAHVWDVQGGRITRYRGFADTYALRAPTLTDAKVVRIWRTAIDPARADEYDEFVRAKSVPMFRAQAGLVAVAFTSRASERAVITFWEGWDAVEALGASASYQATVNEIETAGFLRGEQSVETFALDGMFSG